MRENKNHNQNKAHIVPMLSGNMITEYFEKPKTEREWEQREYELRKTNDFCIFWLKSRQIYRQ